jgi:CheY-like chemotaxis protein
MRRRLLCVDDDSAFRQFYKNLLGSYGYDVTVAANGPQALEVLLSHKIDAVLTDMEMPEMTGAELAVRLKKMRPGLPVLLVSGSKDQTPLAAIDASIPKGTSCNKMVDQIETVMGKYRKQRPTLTPRRFVPLGSVLATIAIAAFALPRLWK